MVMSKTDDTRIDKFLWSVRIYKTRSKATDACKNGRILIDNIAVKPSRAITESSIITVKKMPVIYTFKVKAIPPSRLGAKLVPEYIDNLTPEEELEKLDYRADFNAGHRPRGSGRPTKRDRRDIDKYWGTEL